MPNTPRRYRLVIFDAIDDPQELREVVCSVTGMHPTDAVQWLARAPGVWPQQLEEPAVRKLLDGLYECGSRGRGVACRPVSGTESRTHGAPGRLPERGISD